MIPALRGKKSMTSLAGKRFAKWLRSELKRRKWRVTDLERESGLHYGTLANILNLNRQPGIHSIEGIAKALNLPVVMLLEKAGYPVTFGDPADPLLRRLLQVAREMTPEQRLKVAQFALDTFREPDTELELLRLLERMRQQDGDGDEPGADQEE